MDPASYLVSKPVLTGLDECLLVESSLDWFGFVWTGLDGFGRVWTRLDAFLLLKSFESCFLSLFSGSRVRI